VIFIGPVLVAAGVGISRIPWVPSQCAAAVVIAGLAAISLHGWSRRRRPPRT
jgi:hypothetical protein